MLTHEGIWNVRDFQSTETKELHVDSTTFLLLVIITFGDTLLVTFKEKPLAITTIIILLAASTFNITQQTMLKLYKKCSIKLG